MSTSQDNERFSAMVKRMGGYEIRGQVYFRESTEEWVLELEGTINDCSFTSRHTAPKETKPEDVPGLAYVYHKVWKLEDKIERQKTSIRRLKNKIKEG